MLAALLYGAKDLRVHEVPKPSINSNEILLKVASAAVCGSDIRMFNNGYKGITESTPKILGHEICGIIEEVGENVSGYTKGMRVAVAPNWGCGVCDQCVSGNTHLCSTYKAFGINENGGFAEYVKVPEEAVRQGNLVEVPAGISSDEVALIEPLSCVYNGQRRTGIEEGDTVLVIGAGPIGIMHAMLAKAQGASKVMVNDLSEERLEICKKIDSSILTVSSDNLKQNILDLTNGKGLDVCIVACPAPQAQTQSLELMNMNGKILFFGGLPAGREIVPINSNLIHYKQLSIFGSTRASLIEYRKMLYMVASGQMNLKGLVSNRFRVNEIAKAFELAAKADGLKNVIYFD